MFLFQRLELSLVLSIQDGVWLLKECHKVLMYWVWYLLDLKRTVIGIPTYRNQGSI